MKSCYYYAISAFLFEFRQRYHEEACNITGNSFWKCQIIGLIKRYFFRTCRTHSDDALLAKFSLIQIQPKLGVERLSIAMPAPGHPSCVLLFVPEFPIRFANCTLHGEGCTLWENGFLHNAPPSDAMLPRRNVTRWEVWAVLSGAIDLCPNIHTDHSPKFMNTSLRTA